MTEQLPDLTGDELLQSFVDQFIDGVHGCSMEYDDAQALAVAIRDKLEQTSSTPGGKS